MKDKQVYRELKEVTSEALDTVKRNFEWVAERVKVRNFYHWTIQANLKNIFVSPYPTLLYWYWSVSRKLIFLTNNLKLDTH